jgi:hypothetical protein
MPHSIVHATQFFEFVKSIAGSTTQGNQVRLAPVFIQPMASDDVAKAVGRISVGTPTKTIRWKRFSEIIGFIYRSPSAEPFSRIRMRNSNRRSGKKTPRTRSAMADLPNQLKFIKEWR